MAPYAATLHGSIDDLTQQLEAANGCNVEVHAALIDARLELEEAEDDKGTYELRLEELEMDTDAARVILIHLYLLQPQLVVPLDILSFLQLQPGVDECRMHLDIAAVGSLQLLRQVVDNAVQCGIRRRLTARGFKLLKSQLGYARAAAIRSDLTVAQCS